MGKAVTVAAAAVGYVLGARAGRERYDQIKGLATRVWENPTIRDLVGASGQGKRADRPGGGGTGPAPEDEHVDLQEEVVYSTSTPTSEPPPA